LLICGFVWLSAVLSKVLVVEQFALVGMLICVLWSVLGNQVTVNMLFPLGFLFLMVPFGEDFVPYLMEFTASFTVAMLRLTGISVYREGLHFTLVTGNWSVVEACSGIRYLIASITLGLVYAYLNYSNYTKRALFILASITVPILANGLRAYMIVMIGHLSSMKLATGVDHIIYGWVFFGLVMLLLFYIGSFWQDSYVVDSTQPVEVNKPVLAPGIDFRFASVFTLSCFLIWPVLVTELHDRQKTQATIPVTLLENLPAEVTVAPDWQWVPKFNGVMADAKRFVSVDDQVVGLYIANFGDESQGGELINSQNNLLASKEKKWRVIQSVLSVINWSSQPANVEETVIDSEQGDFLVMRWYRIGGTNTANNYYAKWLQLLKRLSGDASPELMLVIYTPTPHADYQHARNRLHKIALACCQ
jgi:exosortase A